MGRARGRLNAPLLSAAIASALLIVVLVIGWVPPHATSVGATPRLQPGPPLFPANATALPGETIVQAGSVVLLAPDSYQDFLIKATMKGIVGGAFESNQSICSYVMVGSAFFEYETERVFSTTLWQSGPTEFATLDLSLAPGTYYLVLVAPASGTSATVSVLSTVDVTFPLNDSSVAPTA